MRPALPVLSLALPLLAMGEKAEEDAGAPFAVDDGFPPPVLGGLRMTLLVEQKAGLEGQHALGAVVARRWCVPSGGPEE